MIKLKVEFYKNGKLKSVFIEAKTEAIQEVARILDVARGDIKSIIKV